MKTEQQAQMQAEWWLGVAEVATAGLEKGALAVERVHLSIADESFNILSRIPVTRPFSDVVRDAHHGISRTCYRSVAEAAAALNRAVSP